MGFGPLQPTDFPKIQADTYEQGGKLEFVKRPFPLLLIVLMLVQSQFLISKGRTSFPRTYLVGGTFGNLYGLHSNIAAFHVDEHRLDLSCSESKFRVWARFRVNLPLEKVKPGLTIP